MRQSIGSVLVQLFLIGILLALDLGTVVLADEQGRKSIPAEELWAEGVSNMFKLNSP